jgi:hypothetical protein
MILLFSCDSESEKRERESDEGKDGSQEYSVTADERQTCRREEQSSHSTDSTVDNFAITSSP